MNDDSDEAPRDHNQILHLFGARLVKAGWAKRILSDKKGISVDWDPEGRKKMAALFDMMEELEFRSFKSDDVVAFLSFLTFEGSDGTSWR